MAIPTSYADPKRRYKNANITDRDPIYSGEDDARYFRGQGSYSTREFIPVTRQNGSIVTQDAAKIRARNKQIPGKSKHVIAGNEGMMNYFSLMHSGRGDRKTNRKGKLVYQKGAYKGMTLEQAQKLDREKWNQMDQEERDNYKDENTSGFEDFYDEEKSKSDFNKRDIDSIPKILSSKDRNLAGATAAAKGLFLKEVIYD